MARAVAYSDLEVGQSPIRLNPIRPNEAYSTLQLDAPDLSQWDTTKELAGHYDPQFPLNPEKVEDHHVSADAPNPSKSTGTVCGLRPKIFWIALVLSIVVTAAIVGGALGGTMGKDRNHGATSINSTLPANTTGLPSASQLLSSTALSTAAWNDTAGTLQQRLYVQAHDNNIWELSWDAEGKTWSTSSRSIALAKSGSPLAAAVAYKGRTNVRKARPPILGILQQLNLYYINDKGDLMQTNTTDYTSWDTSPISTSNGTIAKPAQDSNIAATWYRNTVCADCSYNSFVVYQDSESGRFQLVNASTSGDVQSTILDGAPVSGSGVAFGLQWRSRTQGNIRLSYQLESGQMASTAWNSMYLYRPPCFVSQATKTPPFKLLTGHSQVPPIGGVNGKPRNLHPHTPGPL
ncbi:MAG: hypothetical protein Q9196_004191 [Gyalolechia fulgens]